MDFFNIQQEKYTMKLLSSLEKVFQDEEPVYKSECLRLSALWGETVSFQATYTGRCEVRECATVRIETELKEHIRVRTVEQIPVGKAVNCKVDDNYLKTTSGLYPDLLRDLKNDEVIISTNQWKSLWIDVKVTDEIKSGIYDIKVSLEKEGVTICSQTMKLIVYGVTLPKQKLIHTEWMHADCLADYYNVEVFSEEHWEILKNYFIQYVDRGGNMMLTPLFTSPLDTAVGLERTTAQLIDVEVKDGGYICVICRGDKSRIYDEFYPAKSYEG